MDQRTRVIIIGAGVLFVLAAISLLVFFTLRFSRNNQPRGSGDNSLSRLPVISVTPSPTDRQDGNNSNSVRSDFKTFISQGFSLDYPSGWGVLTCGNSTNFEFDPENGSDLKNIACDRAFKPITVLLANRLSCTGETVKIGDKQVVKLKVENNGDINYRWCLSVGSVGLDITHRVSQSGSRATSKEDFSSQVEEVIKTIKLTPRGS